MHDVTARIMRPARERLADGSLRIVADPRGICLVARHLVRVESGMTARDRTIQNEDAERICAVRQSETESIHAASGDIGHRARCQATENER